MTIEDRKEYQRKYYHRVIKLNKKTMAKRNKLSNVYRLKNLKYFQEYGKKYRAENKEYFTEYLRKYREL